MSNGVDKEKKIETNYIRLRGLPFSAKEPQIKDFLQGVQTVSIIFTHLPDGRATGECFCELKDREQVKEALKLHRNNMNNRYIEVFDLSLEELNGHVRRGIISEEGKWLRLRGIPFSATVDQIKEFLTGLDCDDVVIGKLPNGRASGEAFVRMSTKDMATKALELNKKHMGSRYVEVFRATSDDIGRNRAMMDGVPLPSLVDVDMPPRPLRDSYFGGPDMPYPPFAQHNEPPRRPFGGNSPFGSYEQSNYGRGDRAIRDRPPYGSPRAAPYDVPRPLVNSDDYISPTRVFMRGLPFDVSPEQIEKFFHPLRCMEIKIGFGEDRRPSGDGSVEFSTMSEAHEALGRNRDSIGSRYIELFPASQAPPMLRRVNFRYIGGPHVPPAVPLSNPNHGGYRGQADHLPGPPKGYQNDPYPSYPPRGERSAPTYNSPPSNHYPPAPRPLVPPFERERGYDRPPQDRRDFPPSQGGAFDRSPYGRPREYEKPGPPVGGYNAYEAPKYEGSGGYEGSYAARGQQFDQAPRSSYDAPRKSWMY